MKANRNKKHKKSRKRLCKSCLIACAFLITGCSLGPRYNPPASNIPCEWHSPLSQEMSQETPDCFLWWKALNDPLLTSLIERAALQNLDLYIAGTRVMESRIGIIGSTADLYPHIDGSLTTGQLSFNRQALLNDILCTSCPGRRRVGFFEAGFDASWELDLFGRTAHEIRAAEATSEAAEEAFLETWITLAAEVARNYIELRGLQQRECLLLESIAADRKTLELTQDLIQIGFSNSVDSSQIETQLQMEEAQLMTIQPAIHKAIHRLSILLGYQPAELSCELSESSLLPCLPQEQPIGFPSELLRRRPDIRKAEKNLEAATEKVGSAIASMFPRISLTGFVGGISSSWNTLTSPQAGTYFIAPQLLLPLFNSSMITQSIDLSKIQTRQACYIYQKTVLEAFEETENAIAALRFETQRFHLLQETVDVNRRAYAMMQDLYHRGIKSYLELLATRHALLSAEDALIQAQVSMLTQYIALYKALAGGWEIDY